MCLLQMHVPGVWLYGREYLGANSKSSCNVGRGPTPLAKPENSLVLIELLEELDSLLNSPLLPIGFCTD